MFEFMISEEWVIGICESDIRDFGSRFGHDEGAEQITTRCMCSGIHELPSRQEAIGQEACCSQWFIL